MRSGAKFSNGKPITPKDIKYTFMRLMNPAIDTGTGFYFTNVVGAPAYLNGKSKTLPGITTTANTMTFHLTAPDGAFLYKTALPTTCPVPVGTAMKPQEERHAWRRTTPAGRSSCRPTRRPADRAGVQQEL